MARFDGLQKNLLNWKLSRPKIYGSFKPGVANMNEPGALRMGADCQRLRFSLREDIPSVIRIAQAIVSTEVKEAYDCLSTITSITSRPHSEVEAAPRPNLDFQIAMFFT